MTKFTGAAAALAAMALLAACEGMPAAPAEEAVATKEAGYGRAFGRVEYLENGQEVVRSQNLLRFDTLTLFVQAARGGHIFYMDIAPDGDFHWPLQAGDYVIIGYQWVRRSAATAHRTGRLMTSFSVPQAGQAVYIGNLRIDIRGSGARIDVLDRHEAALQAMQNKFPEAKFAPAKGLMRLEARLGKHSRVTPICGVNWGLECDGTYQGVRPHEDSAWNYAVTKDLAPLLAWEPSRKAGVGYDVAIYESLELSNPSAGVMARLRGALVAYAEGVREPRYAPAPLEPGKRYEWTVRLRDGDAVSSWSTTSYAFFAVVFARRASGQYFGFETPPAR